MPTAGRKARLGGGDLPDGRRRFLRRCAVAFGVLLVLAVAAAGLTATPLFAARTIDVSGLDRLTRDQVLELAGISERTNVVRFDAGAAEDRLEGDPWIASASVVRSLPSTVRIAIAERAPVAIVALAGPDRDLVAADGVRLGSVPESANLERSFPTIRGAEGDTRDLDPSLIVAGAAVAAGLPVDTRRDVRWIRVATDGGVDVLLRSGIPVAYGSADGAGIKGEVLGAMVTWAADNGRSIEAIDLRIPEAPTAEVVGEDEPVTPELETVP